jgi:nucleotide-binding universal stress UspA family protein
MLEIKHILAPIDFSESSDIALDYAVELAAKFSADVTVMHAYELPIYGFPDGALVATVDVATRISEASTQALQAAVEKRQSRGVKLTAVLRDGVPWEEINAVAEEVKADLIVMSTHARRGLRRALIGSVAENVIRTTSRPVLTLHGPREGREERAPKGR